MAPSAVAHTFPFPLPFWYSFPRDSLILRCLPLTPHSVSFLLLLDTPPVYISCALSHLFLQLFHRNDFLGLLNVWAYSVHLPQPSLASALSVESTPRTSELLSFRGSCNSNDRLWPFPFSSPRKASEVEKLQYAWVYEKRWLLELSPQHHGLLVMQR